MSLDGLDLLRSGKVRDIYRADDGRLLLVASDRVSTFDVVHPTAIPDKGPVLTGVSRFWFDHLADVVDNHLVSTDVADFGEAAQVHADELHGRTMLVREAEIIPFECVVRGRRVRLEGVPAGRDRLRHPAGRGAGGGRPPARADLHAGHEGRTG